MRLSTLASSISIGSDETSYVGHDRRIEISSYKTSSPSTFTNIVERHNELGDNINFAVTILSYSTFQLVESLFLCGKTRYLPSVSAKLSFYFISLVSTSKHHLLLAPPTPNNSSRNHRPPILRCPPHPPSISLALFTEVWTILYPVDIFQIVS